MGHIYQYHCSNCKKIKGEVFYGVGMRYSEDLESTGLHCCDDCGKVFPGNIYDIKLRCPKCGKFPDVLDFNDEEFDIEGKLDTNVKCPNCKKGTILLEIVGLWD